MEYATKRYRSNLINWGMIPFIMNGNPAVGGLVAECGAKGEIRFGIALHVGLIGREFALVSPLFGDHDGERQPGFTRREMKLIASLVDLQRDVDGKGEILFFVGQDGHLLDIPASGLDIVFPGGRKAAERNVLGSDFMAVVDQVDAVIDGSSRRYDDLRISLFPRNREN